jgi:hypothetical protein
VRPSERRRDDRLNLAPRCPRGISAVVGAGMSVAAAQTIERAPSAHTIAVATERELVGELDEIKAEAEAAENEAEAAKNAAEEHGGG